MIYIFWTCAGREEARQIVKELLEEHLIACASLLVGVESHYPWKGNLERADEVKVILKTREEHFQKICSHIREKGSYEVPEIASVKAERVFAPYLEWVFKETTNK